MPPPAEPDQPLAGMRILVADDEFLIRICVEEALRDGGADIVSAATLPAALAGAADASVSAALLDVRLGPLTTASVADLLATRRVPFVFYTGQALPEDMRAKHPGAKVLVKPGRQDLFVSAILQAVGSGAGR